MAMLGSFLQTPTEKKQYTLDYSNWLQAGESISGVPVFSVVPPTGWTVVAPVVGVVTVAGSLVNIMLSGGDDGAQYKCLVTTTTTANQIKEDEFLLNIKAP